MTEQSPTNRLAESDSFFSRAAPPCAFALRHDHVAAFQEFVAQAWKTGGRKVHKAALFADIYAGAQTSIALPVASHSAVIALFRLVLEEYLALGRQRENIALQAEAGLANNLDQRLMTVPGVGPNHRIDDFG